LAELRRKLGGHLVGHTAHFLCHIFFTLTLRMSNAPLHNPCMKTENEFMQVQIQVPDDQFTAQSTQPNLPINDALQIKAAEYWLKLGEADQALKELEALPTRVWKCGWAIKTRIAAIGVLREADEMAVQA
jgi:hypothetical protein